MARFKRSPRKIDSNQGITNTNSARQVRINPNGKTKPKSLVQFLTGFYRSNPVQTSMIKDSGTVNIGLSPKQPKTKNKSELGNITKKSEHSKITKRTVDRNHGKLRGPEIPSRGKSATKTKLSLTKDATDTHSRRENTSQISPAQLQSNLSQIQTYNEIIDLLHSPPSDSDIMIVSECNEPIENPNSIMKKHNVLDLLNNRLDHQNNSKIEEDSEARLQNQSEDCLSSKTQEKNIPIPLKIKTVLVLPNRNLGVPIERRLIDEYLQISSDPKSSSVHLSPKKSTKSNLRRINSNTGVISECLTCSRRVEKCDNTKPNCYNCSSSELFCLWPSLRDEFVNQNKVRPVEKKLVQSN